MAMADSFKDFAEAAPTEVKQRDLFGASKQIADGGEGFCISAHAICRAQQRGIRPETIALILAEADREVRLGQGLISIRISRRRIGKLVRKGHAAAALERTSGVFLVVDPERGTVITACHDRGQTSVRYRRQFPTRAPRKSTPLH